MGDWDVRYIRLAREISSWSKDPSTQIGAVAISESGVVLAQGYNGFPRGVKDEAERYNNRETKYRYVVHAETNCIYNATYNGVSLNNSTMYVYGLPVCNECAKGIIQVGVKRVVGCEVTDPDKLERWSESINQTTEMFKEAGISYDILSSKSLWQR